MRYDKGKTYYTKLSFEIQRNADYNWTFNINRGFHSYVKNSIAANSYTFTFRSTTSKIIKMIVPKGAKYFITESEIVSDKLLFPITEPKSKQKKK